MLDGAGWAADAALFDELDELDDDDDDDDELELPEVEPEDEPVGGVETTTTVPAGRYTVWPA